MAIQNPDASQAVEREMSNYQRNLVDTCFEEGNYDSAISLLDNLRHPSTKPYPAHIRNVVCIALYPPPPLEDDHLESRMDSIPSSPSKYTASHQRASHAFTASASEAAQRLLKAYARTNTPDSLLCALPGYGLSDLKGLSSVPHNNATFNDDSDSEISRYFRHVRDAKNCWDILREGHLSPDSHGGQASISSTRGSRRGRRGDISDREESPSGIPAPVGQHAWPVLEWLLMAFEKDEAAVAASGQPRYSPLLLAQIPSSRSASSSRWDIEAPLDIAFYCLEQHDRSSLGARLLTLVINLTGTIFVDVTMILNAVCMRTMRLTATTLQSLFALLPSSPTASRFKVALCKLCIAGTSSSTTRRAKPRPQARAAPRPLPARQRLDPATAEPTETKQETIRRVLPSPPSSDILELLSGPCKAISPDVVCQLRYNIVRSFAELQEQLEPSEKDQAWQEVMKNGELSRVIDGVFAKELGPDLVEELKTIINISG